MCEDEYKRLAEDLGPYRDRGEILAQFSGGYLLACRMKPWASWNRPAYSYPLDAPDEMPAGGCFQEEYQPYFDPETEEPPEVEIYAQQSVVWRD